MVVVNPNFNALWIQFLDMTKKTNNIRLKSVLENHRNRPEYICRKFGVISGADIVRIQNKILTSRCKSKIAFSIEKR
jgi:hypothetical protein